MGEFSCVYISLSDFKYFPFVEAATSMNELLKHTKVTPLASAHLTYTRDFKDLTDPPLKSNKLIWLIKMLLQ